MAQHDYVIDNGSGSAVLADINSALQAVLTLNSNGSTSPSTTNSYMLWMHTTDGIKQRNNTNTSWIAPTLFGLTLNDNMVLADAKNISVGTTTGTKIGTTTAQKIGFFNATPVIQPSALTTQLTTITHTAPSTPDYAIQNVTNSSPFGFVTANEANSVLSVIANLQTRVAELESKLQSLGLVA